MSGESLARVLDSAFVRGEDEYEKLVVKRAMLLSRDGVRTAALAAQATKVAREKQAEILRKADGVFERMADALESGSGLRGVQKAVARVAFKHREALAASLRYKNSLAAQRGPLRKLLFALNNVKPKPLPLNPLVREDVVASWFSKKCTRRYTAIPLFRYEYDHDTESAPSLCFTEAFVCADSVPWRTHRVANVESTVLRDAFSKRRHCRAIHGGEFDGWHLESCYRRETTPSGYTETAEILLCKDVQDADQMRATDDDQHSCASESE